MTSKSGGDRGRVEGGKIGRRENGKTGSGWEWGLFRKRMGEGTESLSQSLSAPLIPYEASYGRLKGLSGITMVRGSLSHSLFSRLIYPLA